MSAPHTVERRTQVSKIDQGPHSLEPKDSGGPDHAEHEHGFEVCPALNGWEILTRLSNIGAILEWALSCRDAG